MDKHMEEMRKWNALPEGQQEAAVSTENKKRNRNTLRTGLYTAIAVILVMSAVMGSAWAYFTSFAQAKGSVALKLGHEEHIDEEIKQWEKILDIYSEPDSNPVYLRARAYCAEYEIEYTGNNWEKVGDWVYYLNVLGPKDRLSNHEDQLKVRINGGKTPENVKDGKTFNVIVVYESTEVQYDDQGNPINAKDADWSKKVDTHRKNSTLGGE